MRRKTLIPASTSRFMRLVQRKAKELGISPNDLCGISRATYFRWKSGQIRVPVSRALAITQKHGLDEQEFLGRESIVESWLQEQNADIVKYRALHEHHSKTGDQTGKAQAISQTALILQNKLLTSGNCSLLSIEQTPDKCHAKLAISRQGCPLFFITLFSENHELFAVLEDEEARALIGFTLSNAHIRKLLSVLRNVQEQKSDLSLDMMAQNLIISHH